jgi:hypothetical protein
MGSSPTSSTTSSHTGQIYSPVFRSARMTPSAPRNDQLGRHG